MNDDASSPAVLKPVSPFALFAAHPPGLKLLFFTELWERFSYYGMRALLVLYLTKYLAFSDTEAYAIYGAYTALVYIGPVIGGFLADRFLGPRRAVALGGILIALGHFTLALGAPGTAIEPGLGAELVHDGQVLRPFYLALALLIAGEAFFKANISTLVGKLYEPGDPRRDAGFTLFYMGINIGAFAAMVLCAWLASIKWAYGFGLAGIGMVIGLAVFLPGLRRLGALGDAPDPARLRRPLLGGVTTERAIYLCGLLIVALAFTLMQRPDLVGLLLAVVGVAAVLGLIVYAVRLEPEARDRLFVVLILGFFTVVFWALSEQSGSSLTLLADRNVGHDLFGFHIEAAQFQSFNPLFILLLAPVFSWLWPALAHRGQIITTPAKFAIGLLLMGAGFAVLVVVSAYSARAGEFAAFWLVLVYFLHTAGEMALSPIGLSMVTKLAPGRITGLVMGGWFLAMAGGEYLAAQFAKISALHTPQAGPDRVHGLFAFAHLFGLLALIAFFAALLLFGFKSFLEKRMHGAD